MSSTSDQSKRSSKTQSNATQNNVAASEGSQTNAQVITGANNRTGNTTVGNNADISIQSLDPATIEDAFGLTRDVVENLANLANNYTANASETSERATAEVSNALEHFGSDLSTVTQRQVDAFTPDGGKDKIILTALAVGGAIAVAALLKKKP
jgi:hypothetical protein